MGEVLWIVKNPATMKYNQFKDVYWQVIKLFDGTRTRTEILDAINRRMTTPVSLELVLEYEEFLRERDLIEQSAAERSLTLLDKYKSLRHKKAEEKTEGFNPFFIMFHVLDPDRFLNRTIKYVGWIWSPPAAIATLVASVWTAWIFGRHWGPLWSGTMDLYHFLGKPFLDIVEFFFILSIIGAIHEFAHAYALKKYGGECHDIGFALFYFTPAFYCDTSDAFMFPNQMKRLWVTIAGIYSEVAICAVATFLWVVSYPDTLVNQLAYKTMLFTGISAVFFNINPLIKVDGYYALSSLLKLPDLREAAWGQIGAWIQKRILRLPVEVPATTRRKRRLYWIYGTLSIAYTATIMFVIYKLFDNFYSKYFPDFGVVLLVVTLSQIFRKKARTAIRVGKLFYLDKKELVKSPRSRVPLAAVAAVLLAILLVPWSRRTIRADALLKPATEVSLASPQDGTVVEVFVHEGDAVRKGQPLFRISSARADEELARRKLERERFAKRSSGGREAADPLAVYEATQRGFSAETAVQSSETRRDNLLIRSPIDGRVLTPRTEDLVGRNVAEGFTLARVGNCRRMVAQLPVSERLLEYLKRSESVTAQIHTLPMRTWRGRVQSISPATLQQPVTATAGTRWQLPSSRPDQFVALTVFENAEGTLLPGAAARVKIRCGRESYASRAWSVVWRRLRTVVW
ncbi:MAG TPA: efflux RND transporter periplasmic adaptor subunit [Thermoanaerobaculia bacterium]|nr:efflux RND transporter periplasmic adaptor subunit [Thermoanaerobaculia bacterium]